MIRQSANELSPSGRPDTVFFIPEVFNSTSYLQEVDPLDLAVAKDVCCEIPQDASFETFCFLKMLPSNVCISTYLNIYKPLFNMMESNSRERFS